MSAVEYLQFAHSFETEKEETTTQPELYQTQIESELKCYWYKSHVKV